MKGIGYERYLVTEHCGMVGRPEQVRSGIGFTRSAWLFAAMLVLAQAGLVIWNTEREYNAALEAEYARLADAARITDESITGSLRAIDLVLMDVAAEYQRREATDLAAINEYMATRARAFPEVRTVLITNQLGSIISSTQNQIIGMDVHERPYYTQVKASNDRSRPFFTWLVQTMPIGLTHTPTRYSIFQ
ncbi:MAG: hypothetical protein WCF85_19550, partial [Rhodospirillaceae bacterium]